MKYILIFFCSFISLFSHSQERPIVFKGALIYPINGAPISNGVLVVNKGKIISVGASDSKIPADAEVKDITGKIIMPGLVDTHSHLGGPEGGDGSAALNPDARAMDAINPSSDGFKKHLLVASRLLILCQVLVI